MRLSTCGASVYVAWYDAVLGVLVPCVACGHAISILHGLIFKLLYARSLSCYTFIVMHFSWRARKKGLSLSWMTKRYMMNIVLRVDRVGRDGGLTVPCTVKRNGTGPWGGAETGHWCCVFECYYVVLILILFHVLRLSARHSFIRFSLPWYSFFFAEVDRGPPGPCAYCTK
jgi:hypothetical protein